MIWVALAALVLIVTAYLAVPLFAKDIEVETDEETEIYRAELKSLNDRIAEDGGDDADRVQQSILERRLLNSAQKTPIGTAPKPIWLGAVAVILMTGTVVTYLSVGSPELSDPAALQAPVLDTVAAQRQSDGPDVQHNNDMSIEDLIGRLEARLAETPQDPQGWILYARSLMTLSQFDEAFQAYEQTLELTDNNPNVAAELASAREYAAQQMGGTLPNAPSNAPGPSREDIAAAQNMTESDRSDMIQGMVEGLADKLAENPNDPAGWTRLLRARKVLGQSAEGDIKAMRLQFKDQPDVVRQVLTQSGYAPE